MTIDKEVLEPPMTTDEFIAAWVHYIQGDTYLPTAILAMVTWHEGCHDYAMHLIGHTPEEGE